MAKILIVEDDKALCNTVQKWLVHEHHLVEVAETGEQALENLKFYKYDLVVLDINLPKISGLDVCRQFRDKGGTTAILMLTGRDSVDDKEKGLDSGADDYLTKPFHLKELSARVRALLRRPSAIAGDVLKSGTLSLETSTFKVLRDGLEIQVSQQEFALLEFLMRNANQVFSPEALLDRVWKSSSDVSPAAIRTHVKMLRKKIDKDGEPSFIKNIHGVGYRFESR
jgi:DNA-binding response OmpR family regulator